MVVATSLLTHDQRDDRAAAILFLNSPAILRWAEVTLGL
jgi:hypothetical protein